MAQNLQQQLRELGSKLETPPASKDALIKLLKQASNCLSELDQSPLPSMLDSLQPCLNAIAQQELLKHQDRDVKVLVATCICEITRITAPDAPYSDDVLRDIFRLIVGTFSGLDDVSSASFGRRVVILETVARYRSCIVMLDLECNDLINDMFSTFFTVISDDHPNNVLAAMQTIMVLILDESEDIQDNILGNILSALGRKRNDVSKAARRLAMNVIEHCAGKLEPCIKQFLVSSLSGDSGYLNNPPDYHEVIYDTYQCAPQILAGIIPYMTGELLTDKLDVRMQAVQLLGDLFSLPGFPISENFQPLFSEFVKRLTDRVVEVRISVVENLKNCLMSNPTRPEAPRIIKALCDRLLDYDENVRKQVVAAVYDVACHSLEAITSETARLASERLRDKSLSVKRYTMERLADLYRHYCVKRSEGSLSVDECQWIPGRILRCLYDKDFRSEMIELILCGYLFPPELSIQEKVKHWVTVSSGFDKVETKALEQLLFQKQRLQQEMQKYLSVRQTYQEDELQKRISGCFRNMSRLFTDAAKAEESFQILNQLKDVNIWKILANLVDPSISFRQSWSFREELLKILGERHPLYDFMGMLSVKCSYLVFNKEHIKEILLLAATQKSVGNTNLIFSCMNLLAIIASFSPLLFVGFEEDLVRFLKEDNEIIKEGIAHVLAKAGGTIREKLAIASSSVDLLLERLCLEGSRKQAKYSVQALAMITKDDGLKSLSVLYKRLVDLLEEKTHLPAILQSLGCIAHSAMSVYETREDEVFGFIMSKILDRSNLTNGVSLHMTEWDERTELCLLKIYGIKTLVKSYLPVKDAHLRPGIDKLLETLKDILSFGEISKDIESSGVDKAHMRLASAKAVLRLSRQWDNKMAIDLFYKSLKISEVIYPQSRKMFLSKVHQYIKERLLDAKYACAFLLNINEPSGSEYEEVKHNLLEVIQICQQVKVRQISTQCDVSSHVAYPEYILAYLVHALAHHPLCPNIDDCIEVHAFEPIYWRLHLFLSSLLDGNECWQSVGDSDRKKESFAALYSIFCNIKLSEDVVDGAKSKTLHAICDLGMSIMKRIVPDQINNLCITTIPLPHILYMPAEKIESENPAENGENSWLGNEIALAHFEALKLKNNETGRGPTKDEMVAEDSDKDGNEMPLAMMMKILKSQAAKKKKVKKNTSSGFRGGEDEVDVLGVVREINLDKLERAQGTNIIKSTGDHDYHGSGKMSMKCNGEKKVLSPKRIQNNTSNTIKVPTPKRKRSTFVQRIHFKSTKGHSEFPLSHSIMMDENPLASSKYTSFIEKDKAKFNNSDLLISCLPPTKSFLSRNGKKDAARSHIGEGNSKNSKNFSIPIVINKKLGNSRSSKSSVRKRKRRSIAVLAKCSSHSIELNDNELVGSRIKVWWPMDKQFYHGVVQSYDPGEKKHVILYDDGDVEGLDLDKEKWEFTIDDIPSKRPKFHYQSSKKLSPEKTNMNSTLVESRKHKKSLKKKKAPKMHTENNRTSESGMNADLSEAESKGCSDISDVHPTSGSESDGVSSGEPREEAAPSSSKLGEVEEDLEDESEESMEGERVDDNGLDDGTADSDDEPLSAWKLRVGKAT